jgi:hypothetical protein
MGITLTGLVSLVLVAGLAARAYLTPARLTRLAQQTLDKQLTGTLRIGEVRWDLPLSLHVRQLQVGLDPNAPDLSVADLSARVHVSGLVRKQIVIGPVHLVRPVVALHPRDAAHPDDDALAAALAPPHPSPAEPDAKVFDWPIILSDVHISQGSVHIAQPDQQVDLEDLAFDCARLRVQLGEAQTRLEADAALRLAQLSLRPGPHHAAAPLVFGPLSLGVEALAVVLAPNHIDASAQQASVSIPGAALSWSGRAHIATQNLAQSRADGRLAVECDSQAGLWPQLVGAPTWAQLEPRGVVHLALDAQTRGKGQHIDLRMSGAQTSVMGMAFEAVDAAVDWQDPRLTLTQLAVRTPGGALDVQGDMQLSTQDGHITEHALSLNMHTLPLRALMQKLAPAVYALMPSRLDARAEFKGRSLWPVCTTQATVRADGLFTDAPRAAFLPPNIHLEAEAALDDDTLQLHRALVRADGASLTVSGAISANPAAPLAAHIALDAPDPKQTLRRLLPSVSAEHAALTLDVTGTTKNPEAQADIRIAALRQGADRQGQVDISLPLRFAHGVLRCRHGQLTGPAAQLSLVGQASLQTPQGRWRDVADLDVEVRIARAQLGKLLPDVALKGDARLNLHLSGAANRPHMAGVLRVLGLSAGGLAFREATAQLFGDGTRLGIRQAVLSPKQGGHIYAHALLSPQTGGLDAGLSVHDVPAAWLGLKTPTPASVQLTAAATGTLENIEASLEAQAGQVLAVSADAYVQTAKQTLRLDVNAHGALDSLAQWLEGTAALNGALALVLHAEGDWHKPTLHMRMHGDDLAWGNQALGNQKLRWIAETRAPGDYTSTLDLMDLTHLDAHVQTTAGIVVDANARFDALRASAFVAGLRAHGNDALATATGQLHYVLPQGAAPAELSAALNVTQLEASAAGRTIALKQPWQLGLTSSQLTASTLRLGGTAGNLEAHGRITGPWLEAGSDARARSFLQGMAQGTIDLNFVAALLPALGHAQGQIAWAGNLSGTLAEPEGTGSVRVDKEWVLRPRSTLIEIYIARGEVHIDKQRLSLHKIEGSLEAGTFAIGGHIDLVGLRPKAYQIHLSANDLPLHTPDLMLEANVVADATGEGLLPLVKGRIDVTRGRFLKKLEFKDFNFVSREPDTSEPLTESAPWLRELRLDLLATSSNGVDIRLDAGAFAVEATLQTDLHITGNALVPHVVGRINAERGSLHFPKADLQLTQAQLDFEPTPKDPLGAALNVQADGEITPSNGSSTGTQTYSVALRVDGPLKELQFDLSSDQGLGKLEILSLLTTGHASLAELTTGSSDDGAQLDAALAFAGSQVSGPLTQLAERQLERALNLRLDLNAEVTQENVRLTAAKNLNRRLRLEGAYTHGISAEQAIVSTRAQLSLTDKLLLEGSAARDLSGAASSGSSSSVQSNVELKYRLVGH